MLTQDNLEQLEAEYKRILHIVGADNAWEIVLRKPKRDEYKQFRSRTHNPAQVADAQEILCRNIIVAVGNVMALPNTPQNVQKVREAFNELLEDFPGVAEAAGVEDALQALVGMAGQEQKKV